jgi:hypothetical protein
MHNQNLTPPSLNRKLSSTHPAPQGAGLIVKCGRESRRPVTYGELKFAAIPTTALRNARSAL